MPIRNFSLQKAEKRLENQFLSLDHSGEKSFVWEWESIAYVYIIDYRTSVLMELQNSETCSLQSAEEDLAISRQFPSFLLPAQEGFFLFWPSFDTKLQDVA